MNTNTKKYMEIQKNRSHLLEVLKFMPTYMSETQKDGILKKFDKKHLFPYISELVGETILPMDTTGNEMRRETNSDLSRTDKPSEKKRRDEYSHLRRKYHFSKQTIWRALMAIEYVNEQVICRAREEEVEINLVKRDMRKILISSDNWSEFQRMIVEFQRGMIQRTVSEEWKRAADQLDRNKHLQKPIVWKAKINGVLSPGLDENDMIILTPPKKEQNNYVWKLKIEKI